MSKRKDPASAVVEFFESASPESAQMMLGIVTGIVKRRAPAKAARPSARTKPARGDGQAAAAPKE